MSNGFGVSPLELMACDAMLQGLVFLDEFTYSAIFQGTTAIPSQGTVQVETQINGDSDFIVQEQNLTAYDDQDALVADPDMLITVTRAGSGREVMNNAQHVANMMGSYQTNKVPGRKPMAGLLNRSNTLTTKLENLSTTVFNRIDVSYTGFKVFYLTNAAGVTGTRQSIFHAL